MNKVTRVIIPMLSALLIWFPQSANADGMDFNIHITLSKKAAAELAAQKEAIVAYVSYFGDPKKSTEKHADEIGQIDLAPEDEVVEIPAASGRAHITGSMVDQKRLDWLAGPAKVNVNIASARKSNPDNILACDIIDGPLPKVQKAIVTLHCGLIEEHLETRLKP